MKKTIILMLALIYMICGPVTSQTTGVHYYLPTMSLEKAKEYVEYDYVVVDQDLIYNSLPSLKWLKQNHADLKILCYFNIVEWFNPMFPDKPWSLKMVDFLNQYPNWWLHGTDGKKISFWQGMYTMNCAIDCPKYAINEQGDKMNYIEFTTDRFIRDILNQFPFDGVLMDNYWDKISWIGNYHANKTGVDRNRDNLIDDSTNLNAAWRVGLAYVVKTIRDWGGPQFIMTANPGHLFYTKYCSGKMFENFPEIYLAEEDGIYQAWYQNLNNAGSLNGPSFFNAREDNYFFTLCSSQLIDNVVFSYLQNTAYNPKWELHLGPAIESAQTTTSGIHSRKFDKGEVFVDPGAKKSWIIYQDGTERKD